MYFSVERQKFIQVLYTQHSHWVTIAIYLSVQLAWLLITQAATITVKFVDMKKKQGHYDHCGIYA